MKNRITNKLHKTISNRTLIAIAAGVVVLITAIFYGQAISTNTQKKWQQLQELNFGKMFNGGPADSTDITGTVNIPILMYHHVSPLPVNADNLRVNTTVSPADFEMQVAWLKGQGYESVTLADLLAYKHGKFKMPAKPVILTFDDGYSDALENAAPILKQYGFVGSFAIITQFPGTELGTNSYATWQEIKQAQKQGMEIISHTQDHFDGTNPKYDKNFILRNLTDSRKDIKSNLGIETSVVVYPYGHYNQTYISLAKQAGFEMGITTKEGDKINMSNLMEVPRIRVNGGESLETFEKSIQGSVTK